MTYMIPSLVKQAGVVWAECGGCGIPWPFPKGFHTERDWRCHRCVQALLATIGRANLTFPNHPVIPTAPAVFDGPPREPSDV